MRMELIVLNATDRLIVASVDDRTFHLADSVPQGSARPGQYLLGGGTGYEIDSAGQRTISVRDYPIIACDGTNAHSMPAQLAPILERLQIGQAV